MDEQRIDKIRWGRETSIRRTKTATSDVQGSGRRVVGGVREAPPVDRPRCRHCRNPIKDHQPVAGPAPDDRGYHLDCWSATEAVQEMAVVPDQREYERQIEAQGLAALLSPYVSGVLPEDSTRSAV